MPRSVQSNVINLQCKKQTGITRGARNGGEGNGLPEGARNICHNTTALLPNLNESHALGHAIHVSVQDGASWRRLGLG